MDQAKKSRKELNDEYAKRPKPAGVFQVKNTANGKILLGSSLNLEGPLKSHRFMLKIGSHRNKALQQDCIEYGEQNPLHRLVIDGGRGRTDEKLLERFPVRVYSSDVGYMKPHRRIFEAAIEQMGVPAEQMVFVGDRVDKDVRGAARMGMKTILMVRNGHVPRGRVRPDHIVRALSEVPTVLRT